ncbi:single-stranded DNA-binding protein [Pseudonocardia pini]|uniref:single-stranded DNA-binding protein n=1 Tax=Pseudonocardia pini TaxID=2758030 RepID=UPI0015F03828|nr:single-stranded DNA-binding protein [Pseudonocardia pini]
MTDILTTVVGRLTNRPVRRELGSGREVVSFRMACNHAYYDREAAQWKESSTSYVSVDVWRRNLGRNVEASFAKGDPVMVLGRLYVREYEQEGRPRTAVTLVAEAVGPDLNTAMAVVNRVRRAADGSLLEDGSPLSEGPHGPGTPLPRPIPAEVEPEEQLVGTPVGGA